MPRYRCESIEGRPLAGETAAYRQVNRWIAVVLGDRPFRALRGDAADLRQEIGARHIASLRRGRFDPARDFRTYVQGVARRTFGRRRALRERLAAAVSLRPRAQA